ncbi:DNRLRE domain-containing protein [Thermomonospora cellulosilytica]|uniref:RHS repeat-associated protein n=1 Tax=Thermomonospora cellulosilytica TaxID=1411118 RepID=A0A7W3RBY3_9ACTN|nr:DNRLRE domain-containing protein [Thermomonospora cellulosilytica]MBA9007274.1 RHS repeat-associated protein [Thermomonospora cellulosilytica]
MARAEAETRPRPVTPEQAGGTAAGRPHRVKADVADAGAGTERAPKAAKGALPLESSPEIRLTGQPLSGISKITEHAETPERVRETLGEPSGFDAKASKEIPGRRGERVQVFANPDGTETTRFHQGRVHYKDADGTWQRIDKRLVKDATTRGRYRVRADDRPVSFAATANDPVLGELPISEGISVRFGLAESAAAQGTAEGDTVVYEDVRGTADLTLSVSDDGIKEVVTLASPQDPRVWYFPLHLEGLTPVLAEQGHVELRDAEGTVQALIPRGWMSDSKTDPRSGDGARSDGVTYKLVEVDGTPVLQMTLDEKWLDDPERVYPVKVDPSVLRTDTTGDTYVQHPYVANYASDVELKVGTFNGGADKAASYLHWVDIDEQIAGRYIIDAKLGVYNIWAYNCSVKTPVTVHPVTEPWSAGALTTYPGPSYGAAIASKSFANGGEGCAAKWETIDLGEAGDALVKRWADGQAHYGLTLRASVTDNNGWKKFASANSSNEPYLDITHGAFGADYEIVGGLVAQPTNGQAGEVKVKITNTGVYSWYPTGNDEFQLGVRMFNRETGAELNARAFTPLPSIVPPRSSVTVNARIPQVPPGQYDAVLDMYRPMGKLWLSSEGVRVKAMAVTSVDVGPRITDVQPRNNARVGSLTPQLFLKTQSVDNYPAGATHTYQFRVCGGTQENPVDCTTSGWTANGWRVPEGKLKWGTTYFWQGTAREGSTAGPQTQPFYFTPEVEQPAITHHLAGTGPEGQDREVDPKVGNYTRTETDAQIENVGPPISVVRTYNSRDPRTDNAFGAGWSTRYDMRVVPDADGTGNVVVTYPDGQQVRFGKNTDGSFNPPAGRSVTFAALSGGGWKLADMDQNAYVFDASGRLIELTDHRGRKQTLSYGTDGKLAQVSAPGGRRLSFTWSGAHVSEVTTDPPQAGAQPLRWTYRYSDDQLVEVCAPGDTPGNCTRYQYTVASHARTTMADSNPQSYWRLGETGGTAAASEAVVRRGADNGVYHDVQLGVEGSLTGSTDKAARFNGTSSWVELPEGLVPENLAHFTISLRFRTTGGGVLFSYDNRPVNSDALADKHTPVLYVGTDGKLRGQFWNGTRSPITSAQPVNDGRWHHAVITAAGASQTLYLDGARVGTLTGDIVGFEQKYVALGAGTWTGWPATTGDRGFFNGDIDEVAVYDRPLGAPAVRDQAVMGAPTARLIQTTLPSGRVAATISYDAVTERVSSYTTSDGGLWKLSEPVLEPADEQAEGEVGEGTALTTVTVTDPAQRTSTYTFDLLKGSRIVSHTDATGATVRYDYDTGGFLGQITDENGNVTRHGYDEHGNQISSTSCRAAGDCQTTYYAYHHNAADPFDPRNGQLLAERDPRSTGPSDNRYATTYTYSANGDLLTVTSPPVAGHPDGRTVTYTYTDGTEAASGGGTVPAGLPASTTDEAGRTTTRTFTAAGDVAEVTHPNGLKLRYAYDTLGRKIAETRISAEHPQGLTVTFEYDANSQVVSETHPVKTNAVTGQEHQAQIRYTYDADGNVLSEGIYDLKTDAAPRITSWTYDSLGRTLSQTSPEGGTETFGWDEFGNRVRRTDERGTVFQYTYSARDELLEVTLKGYTGGTPTPEAPRDVVLDSYAYDPAGRVASHTDAMGRTVAYRYYDDGELADITLKGFRNPDGTTRDIVLEQNGYDAAGNLTRQITGGGKVRTDFEVDAAGRTVASVLDPEGLARRVELTYDAADNVSSRRASAAGTTRTELVEYAYDVDDNPIRETVEVDGEDLVTTRTYDQYGNLLSETTPRGNAAGADPAAYTTTFGYDTAGNLIKVTRPPVEVTEGDAAPVVRRPEILQGYNAFDDKTHVKDERGHITTLAYDKDGQVTSTTLPPYTKPDGTTVTSTMEYAYDHAGNLISQTDPLGRTTSFTYDQLGNLVKVTQPAVGDQTPVWKHGYTLLGERLWSENPEGGRTEATYDDLGRQITATQVERRPEPGAFTTTFTYDDAGNLLTQRAPGGGTDHFVHNAAGETTKVTDALGRVTTFGYDLAGRQNRVTDPLGTSLRVVYDQAGRPTDYIDENADGQELRRRSTGYDADGNPVTETDGHGRVMRRGYDAAGRLTHTIEPVSDAEQITTRFGYDAAGNRTRLTDGRGNVTTYTYTPWGLQESVIEPATTAHPAPVDRAYTTVYDAAGRPTELHKPGGVQVVRTFDALDRLTSERGSGGGAQAAERSFGYDLLGRLSSARVPGAEENRYTWDDRGNLLTARGPSGNGDFGYDAESRLVSRTDAAGTTTFTWDDAGQLTAVSDPLSGRTATYGYDAAGRLESIGYGEGGGLRQFAYDPLGRVRTDTLKDPDGSVTASISYTHDIEDRLISKTTTGVAGAGTSTYTYDHAGRLTSWTAPNGQLTTYRWDAAGNRVEAGDTTATFDERNRPLTAGDTTYTWTQRGTMATRAQGGQTRSFTFDALDQMVSDGTTSYAYDALGRMVQHGSVQLAYAGLDNNAVADGTTKYARDPFGEPLSVLAQGGTASSILTDQHTDAVATFDPATGAVRTSTAFDPFGRPVSGSGTGMSLGFQGEFTDPNTGLVNMHARWYSPELGSFISRDDYLAEPEPSVQANRYTYGNASPLEHTDPSGRLAPLAVYIAAVLAKLSWRCLMSSGCRNAAIRSAQAAWRAAKAALDAARKVIRPRPKPKPPRRPKPPTKPKRPTKPKTSTKPRQTKPTVRRPSVRKPSYRPRTPSRGGGNTSRGGGGGSRGSGSRGGGGTKASPPKPSPAQVVRNRAMTPKPRPPMPKTASGRAASGDRIRDALDRAETVLDAVSDVVDIGTQFGLLPADFGEDIHKVIDPISDGMGMRGGGRPDLPGNPGRRDGDSCAIPQRQHSFLPGTPVLMADGSTKPIEKVKTGDKVTTTDPNTGRRSIETVRGTLSNKGTKRLVTITIDTDGRGGAKTGTLIATDNHPFWLPREHRWAKAGTLKPGTWLRTSTGTWVQVTKIRTWTAHHRRVHNLTTTGTHTFHVVAGATPILVHNTPRCGPDDEEGLAAAERAIDHFDRPGGTTGAVYVPGRGWFNDPLSSGNRNIHQLVKDHPAPNTPPSFKHHLEAQVAALMRIGALRGADGRQEATLYIHFWNDKAKREVCGACHDHLEDMLPKDAILRVVFRRRDGSIARSDPYIGNAR